MAKPRKMPHTDLLKAKSQEIAKLQSICDEMYQIMGNFWTDTDPFGVNPVLDMLSDAAKGKYPEKSLLPWSLPPGFENVLERWVLGKKLEEQLERDDQISPV